jgi:hypothetical protein
VGIVEADSEFRMVNHRLQGCFVVVNAYFPKESLQIVLAKAMIPVDQRFEPISGKKLRALRPTFLNTAMFS